mmetsp:Transcript_60241/g.97620  ORF Transcript_60241/g.97620 Transcript_60241/m.97620 type:complete len:728 (+) Transcript_60241:46-2229(+)
MSSCGRWLVLVCVAGVLARGSGQSSELSNVRTVAGGGSKGNSDGLGIDAKFDFPTSVSIASDVDGNEMIFVADKENGRIRKISTSTVVVTTWTGTRANTASDGENGAAGLGSLAGLMIDPTGTKLYSTDALSGKLRVISLSENRLVTTKNYDWGNSGLSGTECCHGYGQAVGEMVYIAAPKTHQIVSVNHRFEVVVVAGTRAAGDTDGTGGAGGQARFRDPMAVVASVKFVEDGLLYVADTGGQMLRSINVLRNTVTTLAGKGAEAGCLDGMGTAARLNQPFALATTPNGERLLFLDKGSHVLREYRLAPPNAGAVSTLAGSCNVPGFLDGAPLGARFNAPMGLKVTSDGALAVIADTGNNAIRSYAVCDNYECEFGKWRGPCDITYTGRCVACTKSINGTITRKALPFDEDACLWHCAVGHWQADREPCTPGDKACTRCRMCSGVVPRNASFSSNGGFVDACAWACDAGFVINAKKDGCDFVPLSNCFESTVQVDASFCSNVNFTLKGCAANGEAHLDLTLQLAKWVDTYLNLPTSCDELLHEGADKFNLALLAYLAAPTSSPLLITPASNIVPARVDFQGGAFFANLSGLCGLSEGQPLGSKDKAKKDKEAPAERCLPLCWMREVMVEAILGTCRDYTHCPLGLNGTKLACCFAMTTMTEIACEDYSTSVLGKYASKSQVRGVCNSKVDCTRPSAAPSTRHTLAATAASRYLSTLLVVVTAYYVL